MGIIENKTGISSIEYKGFLPVELVGSKEYGYLLKFNKIDISIEYNSSVECDVYFTVPHKKISLFMFTYKFKNYCYDIPFVDYVESVVHMVLRRLERVDYTPYIECVKGRENNYILDLDIVKPNEENKKVRTEKTFSSTDDKIEKPDKSTQDKKVKIDVDTEYLNTILECLNRLGFKPDGFKNKNVEKKMDDVDDKGSSEIKDKQIPAKAFVEGLIKTFDTLLTPDKSSDSDELNDIFKLFMSDDKQEDCLKYKMRDRQKNLKFKMQDRQVNEKGNVEYSKSINYLNYLCDKIYRVMESRGYTSFTPSSEVYFNYLLKLYGVRNPDEYEYIWNYCNKKFN